METTRSVTFEKIDADVARLDVHVGGALTVSREATPPTWPLVHRVGPAEAQRYRIEEPWDDDDAYCVSLLPGGDGSLGTVDAQFEWNYMAWAEGSTAENGAALLAALPAGRYLLVWTWKRLQQTPQILLGNLLVERPGNAATLLAEQRLSACAFGPAPQVQPRTDWPLVGVALTDCMYKREQVLFLDCAPGSEGPRTTDVRVSRQGTPVLVIPVTGPLVVTSYWHVNEDARVRALRHWEEEVALPFARRLAAFDPREPRNLR